MNDNVIFLDTETTDLNGEVIQIAIIDIQGKTLMDHYLKPYSNYISPQAEAIHGISLEMLQNKPKFEDIEAEFLEIIKDKEIVIYNSNFDIQMIFNSMVEYADPDKALLTEEILECQSQCMMLRYADEYRDYNEHFNNNRWQKLEKAQIQQCIADNSLQAHNALSDCEMTRRLFLLNDFGMDYIAKHNLGLLADDCKLKIREFRTQRRQKFFELLEEHDSKPFNEVRYPLHDNYC